MPPTELMTARLRLRGWCDADLKAFAALNADPGVMEFFPYTLTREQSDESARRIRDRLDERGWGLWAVQLHDDPSFMGFVGLAEPSYETPFTPCVEIGWRLARAYWGRGYASEAARAALRHGFEAVGLSEIVSFTAVVNRRSRAVMERLGMSYDEADEFDHPRLAEGHPLRRHVLYRLRAQQWRDTER